MVGNNTPRRFAEVVAVLVAAVLLAGCAAVTLPDGPTAEDERLVAAHPKVGRCLATGPADRDALEEFAAELRATGLFSDVVAGDANALPPNVEWIVHAWPAPEDATASGAGLSNAEALSVMTLGIVPLVRTRDDARSYEVYRADAPDDRWPLTVGGEVTGVTGWLALPLHLMPWWFTSPDSSRLDRLRIRHLAVELVKSGALDRPPRR